MKIDKKQELVKVLTSLLGDLNTPICVWEQYELQPSFHEPNNKVFRQGVYRMCIHAIVIALYKYVETNNKYNKELNSYVPDHKPRMDKLVNVINRDRGVRDFRNNSVAHIQNNSEKRALTHDEIDLQVEKLLKEDIHQFFFWLRDKSDWVREASEPKGVIKQIEDMRNQLRDN
ncbi:MAG: hypothetical protein MHMPM18_004799 [Marteilia pararefringens]